MTKPCSLPARDSSAAPLHRRAISARLRKMGILISEVPSASRAEVRAWAAELTDAEVELLTHTARVLHEHAAELAGEQPAA